MISTSRNRMYTTNMVLWYYDVIGNSDPCTLSLLIFPASSPVHVKFKLRILAQKSKKLKLIKGTTNERVVVKCGINFQKNSKRRETCSMIQITIIIF